MDIQSQIIAEAQAQGVDPTLAVALATEESGLNESAISPVGAIGIFQLMPATAAGLGVNPYDAADNIHGGVSYLKQQLNRFGDTAQALAALDWGPENIARVVSQYGADWASHIPAEAQGVITKVSILMGGSLPGANEAGGLPSWAPWAALGVVGLAVVLTM